jgi:hypothetical protein
MNEQYKLQFDENAEIETFYDFHGVNIIRINTTNTDLFLKEGKIFDSEVMKRLDPKGRSMIIYLVDKVPPLSVILKFIENPDFEAKWGVYAVINPADDTLINKFMYVVTMSLNMTGSLRNKYVVKFFNHKYKGDLKDVIDWMNSVLDKEVENEKTKEE